MKILAVSDRVEESIYSERLRDRFGDVDLVLGCGDLPFYYLEYIVSLLNVPLCHVRGNHSPVIEHTSHGQAKTAPLGCLDVDGEIVEVNGLLIGGLEGSMRYHPHGPFQYTEGQMRAKIWRMTPQLWLNRLRHGRSLDILITHAPPRGIHDREDLCHTGFRAFLTFMDRYKPRYLIHGHSHIYHRRETRVTRYGETTVVNAYGYQVLEI
ncbi:MAG TPA: metallophosphoesterase [Anaerolineae bacterium]|nr:metallophosphoesterase [Anaerolineae bacterium]